MESVFLTRACTLIRTANSAVRAHDRQQPRGPHPGRTAQRRHGNGRPQLARMTMAAKRKSSYGNRDTSHDMYLAIQPDYSDLWRLDKIVTLIKDGAVGIVPTDSYPAFVCNLDDQDAIRRLYSVKEMNPSKPLSIMVRNFADIDKYTQGFPRTNIPGQPDIFRCVKKCLPGPYTFILAASKEMPKQILDFQTGRSKSRKTVGVRMPDHPVVQALLEQLDYPLLVSSVPLESPDLQEFEDEPIIPDPIYMMEVYGRRGVEFVVDSGPYQGPVIGSSVIGLSTGEVEIIRRAKGDVSMFEPDL